MAKKDRTTDEILASALASYQAGRLNTARQLLADLIGRAPDHTEAIYTLSVICHQTGEHEAALAGIKRALALNETDPRFHHFLGILLSLEGRHDKAGQAFERALALKPDNADLAYNLAKAKKAQGLHEAAIFNFEKAISLNPGFVDAYYNLGNTYQETGEKEKAKACFEASLKFRPDFVKAHHNLGALLHELGDDFGATTHFETAVRLKPDFAEAHNNLGNIMLSRGRLKAAVASFKTAVAIRNDYPEAHYNLGVAYNRLGKYENAKRALHNAIDKSPEFVEAYNNLGVALQNLGEVQAAIETLNQALHLKPGFTDALWNRALTRLLSGDLENGFRDYEARFSKPDQNAIYPWRFNAPRWDGGPLKGKRLLVHYEQGFGDTLHFVRYLPMVKSRGGGTVILEVQKELYALLKGFDGVDSLIAGKETAGPDIPFDDVVPLLSLPAVFQTRMDTIPRKVPYIFPDSAKSAYWGEQLSNANDFKIGIVWAGNLNNEKGRHRSCSLGHFITLADMPSVRFFGLQKGDAANETEAMKNKIHVTSLADSLSDFSDTCAVISNLDLIISVDTAVAHLAGAMGKRTFVLLSAPCDWRWLLDRSDSPWYPTMTLFRQPRQGDWESVFAQVRLAVRQLMSG